MDRLLINVTLAAAIALPATFGLAPAAQASEATANNELVTIKSDRRAGSSRLDRILASIAAETDD